MRHMTQVQMIFSVLLIVALALGVTDSAAMAQTTDRSTLDAKVFCGYQGWFACPGDGNDPEVGWRHWARSDTYIGPRYYNTEIWPDVTEYNRGDLHPVPNTTLSQGGDPYLFGSRNPGVADTHFKWMQEYSIDGIFLQRYTCELLGPGEPWQEFRDTVLRNVMNASVAYGRAFAVEYDISGTPEADVVSRLQTDWNYLKSAFKIKSHSRYWYHNGKPVVIIWGLGFQDRPGTPQQAADIIHWFENDNCFVIGGVPHGWRTRTGDSRTDSAWDAIYRSFDGIIPWAVGAYADWDDIDYWKNNRVIPDLSVCNSLGILYIPTTWPRFGWDNIHNHYCGKTDISPRAGQHMWDQFYAWKSAGVASQFIAMFDEYDESTAIMKLTDNVPATGCWWTTQGHGKDWYLRLVNQGSKMQRGEIALSRTIPISSSDSPDNAVVVGDTIPSSMTPGQQCSVSVTVRNTGETTWTNNSWWKLGAVGDSDPFCAQTRITMPPGTVVMPNGEHTFSFTITAPAGAGTYTTDWQMVHESIRWFGAVLTRQVEVADNSTP